MKTNQELAQLQEETQVFDELKEELSILDSSEDAEAFSKKLEEKETEVFLSGKYDKGNAILSIYAGAGGVDAQDWVAMLLRMYERYCSFKGFGVKILHQSFGEGGGPEGRIGIKSVTLEIKGKYAHGYLKRENGVHRLVRISPFSSKSLRHTSFALVEVLPELLETEEEISPEDLKIETFRASGPGGQYVNRRESAVRITHLPTGIKAASQSERLQGLNRQTAMKVLQAKLFQFKKEKGKKELEGIKGEKNSISWGNQIRSYVLQPYQMVKDLRTGVEASNVEACLDGHLEDFIIAEIKLKDD